MSTQLTETLLRIREMILRGELAPGQRVAEAPLAELLGMSRTPVRQALPLLAQEGLLAEHETRGYVVRGFTPRTSSTPSICAPCSKGWLHAVWPSVAPRRLSFASCAPVSKMATRSS